MIFPLAAEWIVAILTISKAIPERLGFKEEGRIRNHEFLHGEYLDRTTFGLLKDEWIQR